MTPRLDMIGLVTADLAASLAFYRDLGVPVPDAADGPHVEAALDGGLRLAWDTEDIARSIDPEWQAPQGNPRTGLAFLCDSPSDVDSRYEAMTAAGHRGRHEPWDAPWGQRYATLLDPDGNGVDLFCPQA